MAARQRWGDLRHDVPRMPEFGKDLRFTIRPNEAFYIHSLAEPGAELTVEAPVPVRAGDKVTMLGHDGPLSVLPAQAPEMRSRPTTGGRTLVVDLLRPDGAASGRYPTVMDGRVAVGEA